MRHIRDELISCNWIIGSNDQHILDNKTIFCLGIRIYDVSSRNVNNNNTCIMKEIQVNKKLNNLLVSSPVSNGIVLAEIGYRKSNGKWIAIASKKLYLGERNNSIGLDDDSWFYANLSVAGMPKSLHERLYEMSKGRKNGGSERIHK